MNNYNNERKGYFYQIPAKFFEESNKKTNSRAKNKIQAKALLFGIMSTLANDRGYCFASNAYLLKKLGYQQNSHSSISEYLTELEKEGWIKIEKRKDKGRKIYMSWDKNVPEPVSSGGVEGEFVSSGMVSSSAQVGEFVSSAYYISKIDKINEVTSEKSGLNAHWESKKDQSLSPTNITDIVTSPPIDIIGIPADTLPPIDIFKVGKKIETDNSNKDINELIDYLTKKLNSQLDGSKETNRRYAWNLLRKIRTQNPNDYMEQIKKTIDIGMNDSFHKKNLTNINYLFNNYQKIRNSKLSNVYHSPDSERTRKMMEIIKSRVIRK